MPLVRYLLAGQPTNQGVHPKRFYCRFDKMFQDMNFLMATAIQPRIKLEIVRRINPDAVEIVKRQLIFEIFSKMSSPPEESGTCSSPNEVTCGDGKEFDFFEVNFVCIVAKMSVFKSFYSFVEFCPETSKIAIHSFPA